MPFTSWLQGPLREVLLDTLSESAVRKRGLLDAKAVSGVRDQFLSGVCQWSQPWLLMMIEVWAREVLDSSPAELVRNKEQVLISRR